MYTNLLYRRCNNINSVFSVMGAPPYQRSHELSIRGEFNLDFTGVHVRNVCETH